MTKFSIIIPHYNSPQLLSRCVASIPDREDIQVIVVDDCSAIAHTNFLDFPSLNRDNVEIYSNEIAGGAGKARNKGLEKVRGKWLLFADADDFFVEGCFDLFDRILEDNIDIHYFKVCSVFSDTGEKADRDKVINSMIENYDEDTIHIRVKHIVPWGKVFRSEFVQESKFKFDEVIASNDVIFGLLTGYNAEQIKVFSDCIYCITMTAGSMTNTSSPQRNSARFEVILRYNQFLRKHGLSDYQTSIRPFLFISWNFGLRDLYKNLKLLNKYDGSILFGFNPFRSLASMLRLVLKNKRNKNYLSKNKTD